MCVYTTTWICIDSTSYQTTHSNRSHNHKKQRIWLIKLDKIMYIYSTITSTITPIDRSSSHTHIIFLKIYQRFFKRWTRIIRPGTRMQIRILYMCKKIEWTRPSLRYVNYLRWIGITLNVGYSKKSKKISTTFPSLDFELSVVFLFFTF